MGRTPGARNDGYVERRRDLLASLVRPLLDQGPAAMSFRRMAQSADTSVTTLRHYFGDRAGVLVGVYELLHEAALPHLDDAVARQGADVAGELRRFVDGLVTAWRVYRVGRMHVLGLGEGFTDERLGVAYVQELLEPTIQAAERLLTGLSERGQLGVADARTAAIGLVGPVVLALLHQEPLHGDQCRPLDVGAFLDGHVEGFLNGHRPGGDR